MPGDQPAHKGVSRRHYAEKLADTDDDPRGRWKVIREFLHTDEKSSNRDPAKNQKV